MSKLRLIGPAAESASADSRTSTGHPRALPDDLLQEASGRLGVISLLAAMLWVMATVLFHLATRALMPGDPSWMQPVATDAMAAAAALIAVGMFLYTRREDRNPRFILDLGLVFLVFNSMVLGVVLHWQPVPKGTPVAPTITWIGAITLMSAAIVPASPSKMLVAGLISASMNPLGMLMARARGTWDFGPTINVLVMHYPDFMLVGVAVAISRVVTRLGQQVSKAREMGSYQLVHLLGQGGMGEVWRARHRMLARDAAIKLIQPAMLSDMPGRDAALVRRRFEQEARATATLRSPHTVELYDFGIAQNGVFYYVMELLDGIDLETLVRKYGPQPPARVASIVRQACRSLGEAHRHGMVHRDIKPTNIFLCRMGDEHDFVKVLDFGLVKVLNSNEIGMTGDGSTTGTPAYMAPELALGNPLDGRTDLYGLGCVAYWLATGSLVFEEKGATATMLAHVQKPPVPPSQRSELPVPPPLDRAILMCLAKNPADRPAGAAALARMLDSSDVGSWTEEEAEHWWQTHMPENAGAADAVETQLLQPRIGSDATL